MRAFARFSIPAERLELDGPAEHFTFLERYADIDVALDTFPYNGATTTTEALWQGVPAVAFAGDRWVSRTRARHCFARRGSRSSSQVMSMGSSTWRLRWPAIRTSICGSTRYATIRDRLRSAPVCDVRSFVRNMEKIYLEIWRRQ